jgi:hypothetical protein
MKTILIQAEAFCYGPSAIAARIVGDLGKRGYKLDYVTNGTKVLISDRCLITKFVNQSKITIHKLQQYDYVVVVMDWEFAKLAVEANCKVIFVDALSWFWRDIDPVVDKLDCYLGINFAGVNRVVESINNPNSFVIPQMIDKPHGVTKSDSGVVSIGGVTNPLYSDFYASKYARIAIDSVLYSRPKARLFGNRSLDLRLNHSTKAEFDNCLSRAKYFIGTSGLGHITECIAHGTAALFLPPVNDSQYLQLQLLGHRSANWDYVSWEELGYEIDWNTNQASITQQIEKYTLDLLLNRSAQMKLTERVTDFIMAHKKDERRNELSQLSDWWGYCGERAIGDWIEGKKIVQSISPLQLFPDSSNLQNVINEFPFFFHTTRPENIDSILESRIIKRNPKPTKYGDPLGPHDQLFGQMSISSDPQTLMDLAGSRFPILLFRSSVISRANQWHLSPSYSSGVLSIDCISPFNPIGLDVDILIKSNEIVLDIDVQIKDCIAIIVPNFMDTQFESLLEEYNLKIPVIGFEIPIEVLDQVSNSQKRDLYSQSSAFILAYAEYKFGDSSELYTSVAKRELVT